MKERWKELLAEYGRVAVTIYFSLFVAAMIGFSIALSTGLDLGAWTGGKAGTVAAAWVATKITQPLRIIATLALTPLVAKVFRRERASTNLTQPGDDSEE